MHNCSFTCREISELRCLKSEKRGPFDLGMVKQIWTAHLRCPRLTVFLCWLQGYYKVLGKGALPKQPVIVKAKWFSRTAEEKIKNVGGACILTA